MKTQIAVVGIGAIFPDALDLSEFWSNILAGRDSVKEMSDLFWDMNEIYDPDPTAKDKTYGNKAAVLDFVPFDSLEFGIPPKVMEAISVDQLFALLVAKQALLDANMIGPDAKEFNREKTGVILSSNIGKNAFSLCQRLVVDKYKRIMENSHVPPHLIDRVVERMKNSEFEWTEDSNPGALPNVTAGRIANRFDLYGTNCTVDAACAASFSALKYGINELESGDCDAMLVGGVMLDCTPYSFIAFSKTPAIAFSNESKPFDEKSDGIMLGDGIGMVVIKRLADAERDNDRIYGVIESISSSSDGKAKSIFAPRKEGQLFALRRAYGEVGIDPSTLGMIEAHGTGTPAGDETEVDALKEYFSEFNVKERSIMIGSVKSQVGHSRLAAGSASLIKSLMALYHHTLPPTINIKSPGRKLFNSPFFLTNKPKPWLINKVRPFRRLGVSSFGFGGTNFHVIVREYVDNKVKFERINQSPVALYLHNETKEGLIKECGKAIDKFEYGDTDYFNALYDEGNNEIPKDNVRLGFVAKNPMEAKEKLEIAFKTLKESDRKAWSKQDVFYRERAIDENSKIVTLFPGQGSQYANMLADITTSYREIQDMFEVIDNIMIDMKKEPVSTYVYPKILLDVGIDKFESELTKTSNTQPALAAICSGLYKVLKSRGYKEDFLIGHSFGEITALWAAGAIDDETYANLSVVRGDIMSSSSQENTGMLAIFSDKETTLELISQFKNIYLANENSDKQTIVSGDESEIKQLEDLLSSKKISSKRLKVSGAFHSPYMKKSQEAFSLVISKSKFKSLNGKVIANSTADFYGAEEKEIKKLLSKQMINSVLFKSSIKKAYDDGAKVFVEIGPGKALSSLTDQILEGFDHETISINPNKINDSRYQFEGAVIQMKLLGIDIEKDHYFRRLKPRQDVVRNKSTFMVPPVHFISEALQERLETAVNEVDPLPEEQVEIKEKVVVKEQIEKEKVEKANDEVPKDIPKDTKVETKEQVKAETKEQVKAKEDSIKDVLKEEQETKEILNEIEGDDFMANEESKNFVRSPLQDAYGLQSLNSDVFKQFMQSQNYQLNMFNQMLQIANDKEENNLGGFLNFIDSFQNNSISAYNIYFNEQKNMLSGNFGAEGTAANMEFINVIEPSPAIAPPPMLKPVQKAEKRQEAIKQKETIKPQVKEVTKPEPKEEKITTPTPSTIKNIEEAEVRETKPVEEENPNVQDEVINAVVKVDEDADKKPILNADQLEKRIIEVISDRTGYPVDMIDGEMNIESDLGIDSIKRVEIFSVLNDELDQGFTQEDIEYMTTLSSIRDFAQFLADKMSGVRVSNGPVITQENFSMLSMGGFGDGENLGTASEEIDIMPHEMIPAEPAEENIDLEAVYNRGLESEEDTKTEVSEPNNNESDGGREIKRYEVFKKKIESPVLNDSIITKNGLVLITSDKKGLSTDIGNDLKNKGYDVEYLNLLGQGTDDDCKYKLDSISDSKIKGLYENVVKDGKPLIGYIHVVSPENEDKKINGIFEQSKIDALKANFLLAKHFSSFSKKPDDGKVFFVCVTRMDGNMGLTGKNASATLQGGFYGLVKSLSREWKNTHCKVIDIPALCENSKASSYVIEEIFSESEGIVEVGRAIDGERYTIDMKEKYDEDPASSLPGKDDVFLVTGGGRGVSAVCAVKIAKEYKCKFILLGRSNIDNDYSFAHGETDQAKLRQLVIAQFKETGKTFKPVDVDKMINTIKNKSEIEANLDEITKAGGKAVYYSCDVTNEKELKEAISKGENEMGKITGFAHGVGVIADKKIEKKTEKDFNNVFGTKIVGLNRVMNTLDLDNLKYVIMFSSVAAYFGNEGQTDYSMANEVLNKFVYAFRNKYPDVFALSINWGPWKGGMVSEALQYVITAIGEKMIPLDVGSEYFVEQFRYAFKPETCQICVAGTDLYIPHDIDLTEIM